MQLGLKDQAVLVTGSGGGIGRTIRAIRRSIVAVGSMQRPVWTGEVWMIELRRAVSQ